MDLYGPLWSIWQWNPQLKQYRFDYIISKAYLRNDRELWYQQSLTSLCTIEWIPPAIYRLLGALWRHCHYDVIMTSQCHAGVPATGTYSWITFVTLWHMEHILWNISQNTFHRTHFAEHISRNTFQGTHFMEQHFAEKHFAEHFMEHILQNTLNRTHFVEHFAAHILWNTLHRNTLWNTFHGTHFAEHILWNTFHGTLCGTHFMEHTLWNTFCGTLCGTHFTEHTSQNTFCRNTLHGTHFTEHISWNTFHRTHFVEHTSQSTLCRTHFTEHISWNTLRNTFRGTQWPNLGVFFQNPLVDHIGVYSDTNDKQELTAIEYEEYRPKISSVVNLKLGAAHFWTKVVSFT